MFCHVKRNYSAILPKTPGFLGVWFSTRLSLKHVREKKKKKGTRGEKGAVKKKKIHLKKNLSFFPNFFFYKLSAPFKKKKIMGNFGSVVP